MDDFDRAADAEMLDRDLALSKARSCADSPSPTGFCLWCSEPVEDGLRWCRAANPNESCMQQWDHDRKRRAAQ